MKTIAFSLLLVLTCLFPAQAQVVSQISRENLRIPAGERPEEEPPTPSTRSFHIEMDTTSIYYQLADSAQACVERNDWVGAERCFRAALASDPDNASNALLLSNLGTVLRHQHQLEDALKSYNMALDITPNAVTLLHNRAALLIEMGRSTQAADDLERVRSLDDRDVVSRYTLGMLAVEQHQFDNAKTLFNEILKFSPRSSLANEGLGMMYKEQGDYDRAIERLSTVLHDHTDAHLLAARADCLLVKKRLTEAADDIHTAIQLTPNDAYLYVLRAKLNKMRWNLDDAQHDIDEAVNRGLDREMVEKMLK